MSLTRMGDLIQSTPLIAGLRTRHPDAKITLMVSSDFSGFAERIPDIHDHIVFNLRQFNEKVDDKDFTWIEIYRYLEGFLQTIMDRNFDTVVNLSHSRLSALMIHYLGIQDIRGFHCTGYGDRVTNHPWLQYFGIEPFNRLYNPFNLVDIFTLGGDIQPQGQGVTIKTTARDEVEAEEFLGPEKIEEHDLVIGFQAGSSLQNRRWSGASFAELGDLLARHLNAKIVLLGVTSESELAREIIGTMDLKHHVIDLTGKTTIGQLVGVLKKCDYLVTNDTGTMHIAAALGTTIIGLFFAHAHPVETGPYGPDHLIFQGKIPCAPCSYGVECNHIVCVEKVLPVHLYRMIAQRKELGYWKVPEDMSLLDEVNILETKFDRDNLLSFSQLIKHAPSIQDVLSMCYRRLWLDTVNQENNGNNVSSEHLSQMVEHLNENYDMRNPAVILEALSSILNIFRELKSTGEKGMAMTEKILQVLNQKKEVSTIKLLGEGISRLDERINLTGATYPGVKPLTDMFNKRKENLVGNEIVLLTRETQNCYRKLIAESSRMIQSIIYLTTVLDASSSKPALITGDSIKVAVPGK